VIISKLTSTVWKYENCGCRTLTCIVGFVDPRGDLSSYASWNLHLLLLPKHAARFIIYCPRKCYTCCRELHCLFITLPVRFKRGYNENSYSNCVALANPDVNPIYNELAVIVFKLRWGSPSSSFQSITKFLRLQWSFFAETKPERTGAVRLLFPVDGMYLFRCNLPQIMQYPKPFLSLPFRLLCYKPT
jgi:hypothetical protein